MSQCIFYSLFIAFPKSRHLFNNEFINKLIYLLGYLFNGLNVEKHSFSHWDLDLGTGNIINSDNNTKIDDKSQSDTQQIGKIF